MSSVVLDLLLLPLLLLPSLLLPPDIVVASSSLLLAIVAGVRKEGRSDEDFGFEDFAFRGEEDLDLDAAGRFP
jgi:hypothetical protein